VVRGPHKGTIIRLFFFFFEQSVIRSFSTDLERESWAIN
jgi:hypothetical protein